MLQGRQTVGKVLFDIRGGRLLHRRHRWAAESIGASRRAPPESKIANIGVEDAPRTVDEAYGVQALLQDAALREHNAMIVGKKVAATSVIAQKSVSVDEPFCGDLFSHSTFRSGTTISIHDSALGLQVGFLLIDPEFAMQMNADTKAGVVHIPDVIRGLVGGILPSVEIATSALVVADLEAFKTLGACH